MVISIDEAKKLITPSIEEKLRSAIVNALQDYNDLDVSLKLTLSATTRANFINDRMCFHIHERMGHMSGIDFVKRRGRLHLVIIGEEEALEVKFKKLDDNRRPSNIRSHASQDFMNQVQLEFPGMLHPITNVVAGYQLNTIRTGITGIFIVCPYGSQNKWEIEIPITAVAPATLASLISSTEHEIEPPQKKVVPKESLVKKVSSEE
jgi:hypothetical protein